MADRELTMEDYLAMAKRRLRVVLIPALVAPLGGFLASRILPPRYTTQTTVLVEGQKVPENYVMPVITSDFTQRVQTLSQEVVSRSKLIPVLQGLGVKPEEQNGLIKEIQQNLDVEPVITTMSAAAAASPGAKAKKGTVSNEPLPGFNVIYTDGNAERAQKICDAMTSLMVNENLRSRSEAATSTTNFLDSQLKDAKQAVDDQDAKLAAFKKQYLGQLPTDIDNNMRMLGSLNSQLDATTGTLSRAQQDKAYTESMLAQQVAAWKSSLSSSNPVTLEQELAQLQGQLQELQARYTDDYPDVIKTKAEIADVQKKLKEAGTKTASGSTEGDTPNATEPPEIGQLRLQIHQYQEVIQQAAQDQKKLQSQITIYQSRTAMSPGIEEQYKLLTRDNDNAQAQYKELLAKKSSAQLGTSMENQQEGEQMHIVATAPLPQTPTFPIPWVLSLGGLGVGLGLGVAIGMILEFTDKSIRTEKAAAACTDLPLLISVPWLGEQGEVAAAANGNGHRRFWGKGDSAPPKDQEAVKV